MDIINTLKDANIFSDEDISVFENHSLDRYYYTGHLGYQKNITKLMLLIDFPLKYPQINNVIEQYVKKVPDEINKISECGQTVLDMIIDKGKRYIKIMKILLENGANLNQPYPNRYSFYSNFDRSIMKLILEYDGINMKSVHSDKYQQLVMNYGEQNKIKKSIDLLNKKN